MEQSICIIMEDTKSFDWERSDIVMATTNEITAEVIVEELTSRIDHDAEKRCDYRKQYRIVKDVSLVSCSIDIDIEEYCD